MPGMAHLHPMNAAELSQGALKVMYRLQQYLADVTGTKATSLASMAGAQGELAGVLMIRAYHDSRGDDKRRLMLIPDSAHGTNPASAAMGGFEVKAIPSDDRGNMDIAALKESVGEDLAGIMLTLPSTLGLFETDILEICDTVHKAGGLVYGDGANMNAILGQNQAGRLGVRRCSHKSSQDLQHAARRRRARRRTRIGGRQACPLLARAGGSEGKSRLRVSGTFWKPRRIP